MKQSHREAFRKIQAIMKEYNLYISVSNLRNITFVFDDSEVYEACTSTGGFYPETSGIMKHSVEHHSISSEVEDE